MTRAIIKHGTRNTYERHGCRCDECRAAHAARHLSWVATNRERARELARESYARHAGRINARKRAEYDPVKNAAHGAIGRAVRAGKIERGSCVHAGPDCSGSIDAHHDDYSRPLDVKWYCRRHHRLLHHRKVVA